MLRVSPKLYQKRWLRGLTGRFGNECVKEWAAFARTVDRYSPRLDLAVGPFSTSPGNSLADDYRELAHKHRTFLRLLWMYHAENERQQDAETPQAAPNLNFALSGNHNARCFLAIEIENQVSRKHLMGGIMNAVSLGHLGILVGWTDEKVRAMFRARAYLHFLEAVDKPTLLASNLLILTRHQADQAFSSS